jgi:hypothetical protein
MTRAKTQPHPCTEKYKEIGYFAWYEKVRRLTRQHVRQTLCPICQRYKYPDEECAERMAQRAAA